MPNAASSPSPAPLTTPDHLPQMACDTTPLLIQAARGEQVERPPVWMMRQAGRYMSEYQQVRQSASFLDICKTPDLIEAVSLQPIDAFGMDGCIVFSDILIPLEAMGLPLTFTDAKGPQLPQPIRVPDDLNRLHVPDPVTEMDFVLTGLRRLRSRLNAHYPNVALIGFAGAPWTLAVYAMEGESWKHGATIKSWLYQSPQALHALLGTLTETVIGYLNAQIEAGAQMVQLFDTWAGVIPTRFYPTFVQPYHQQVIAGVKATHPTVPIVLYVKHSRGLLPWMAQTGADVISVDELTPLSEARALISAQCQTSAQGQTGQNIPALQGNLDSAAMTLSDTDTLAALTEQTLKQGGNQGYIFNLGHGVLPFTPRDNVQRVVSQVKQSAGLWNSTT
ncbi:MAG: uroporphyrinogen decarboxylase [Candidatus Melainabacteria bacterium]|nr:uroporphyrinogen decarboxylase [Candidatus Melainabacteria bacterium]